jgi:zinc transport system substrate-binding protein
MLLPPGSESRSFEPTPRDIIKLQSCDVFIYAGGEGDVWVDRILASMDTSNMVLLPMLEMADAVEEEIVEGMERGEHGHSHGYDDHDDDDEHDEHGGHGHDEAFDPESVQDRPLSDWDGAWKSLAPMLQTDSLDAYLLHYAEERELTVGEARTMRAEAWKSDDLLSFSIEGEVLTADGQDGAISAQYTYGGYALVEGDHGVSVWYQYQIADPTASLPSYLLFYDHPTGSADASEHDHDDIAHTHALRRRGVRVSAGH